MPNQTKKTTKSRNVQKPTQPVEGESISPELRTKIKDFKEMFPKYKQSTNSDIIAIFEEFNNDYNAAVYGVLNGLVQTTCTESWQTAGKKPKKKNTGARGRSVTPKNRNDYGERRNTNSNRGQSANTRTSNRGGRTPSTSSRSTSTTSNDNTSQPQAPKPADNPAPPPTKAATQQPQRPPVKENVTQPKPTSQPVTERLSYANVAKSREAWNPNNIGKNNVATKTQTPPAAAAAAATEPNTPSTTTTPVKVEESAPVSTISPTNVQSKPNQTTQAPQNTIVTPTGNANPFNAPKQAVPERQPRVGVLLPGNFTSDDRLSFQFGNLGMLQEEEPTPSAAPTTTTPSAAAKEPEISSANKQPTSNTRMQPHTKSNESQQASEMGKMNANEISSNEMPIGGIPMNQYSPYPMYPGMESVDPSVRPMHFYPDQYNAYSRGDAKYPGRNSGSSNYSGRDSSSKFNSSESSGDKNTGSNAQAAQTPYPYGPYPMYGPPFVNQFHGGSYGNQFYHGFYKNPAFPPGGYNFSNNGMGYAQSEDEYRQKPGQYYSSQEGSLQSGASTGKSSTQSTSPPKQAQSIEGGNYQSGPSSGFPKNQSSTDYYQDGYMGSSFMSTPPFGYPPMGGAYPPQQPQQPTQSSQSSGSQNRNY